MLPSELKQRIEQLLATEVGPALDIDSAGIEVLGVDDGVVRIRLNGACAGCPSTVMSLIMGLEQELRQRIPEIEYLEAAP